MSYDVFSMSPYSRKVGTIRPNGDVMGVDGTRVGRIMGDGKIIGADGKVLATVTREGRIHGGFSNQDIKMDLKGYVFQGETCIGMVKKKQHGIPESMAQWGACALLLQPEEASNDSEQTIVASPDKIKQMIREAKIAAFKRLQELQTIKRKSPFR